MTIRETNEYTEILDSQIYVVKHINKTTTSKVKTIKVKNAPKTNSNVFFYRGRVLSCRTKFKERLHPILTDLLTVSDKQVNRNSPVQRK